MIKTTEGLQKLAGKLQNANHTIVLQKKREKQQIQDRLQQLETRLLHRKKIEQDSLERIKCNSDRLGKLSNQNMKNFTIKYQKQQEIVRSMKDQMQNDLQFEERQHQSRIDEIIQKQTQIMSSSVDALSRKSKQISDKHHKMLADLNKSIHNLQRQIQEEVDARQENCKRIKDDVIDQINKFSRILQKQEERKANSSRKLNDMLAQINQKLINQIEDQANKRKNNNQAVLKLIQCACQKLQDKIKS